ncbi:MAG: hypothetical protein QG670_1308 [Thermoproteota archaeon]|nr:hypothetical protein [Thermoproteota archaeon]
MKYPSYVCKFCAEASGGKIPEGHLSCWHNGICPCCGHLRQLTEPRDFGYPKLEILHEYAAIDTLGESESERQSCLAGGNQSEGKTKQPSEGTLSEIRLDEEGIGSPEAGNGIDTASNGDCEVVRPSCNTITAGVGIKVGEPISIRVDYDYIIKELIARCELIPRHVIRTLQDLDKEQV